MKQPSLVLGKSIGSGPHGKVFHAHFKGQPCAAKQVVLAESSLLLTSLEGEVRRIERLRNRHIIQHFGSYRGDGNNNDNSNNNNNNSSTLTILVDYAEGGSLERALQTRGRLTSWKDKARIAQEIVRGLDFLHMMDILHQDLKSANVLLTKNMEVKLCDFGLSTMVQMTIDSFSMMAYGGGGGGGVEGSDDENDNDSDDGLSHEIKRTVRWMAPELLEDVPAFSTKSDIYALGMVMWEMAANKTPPFREWRDPFMVIDRVREGTREVLPDDTPHDYRHWLEQCWDQDPAERPEAREMVSRDDAKRLTRTASLSSRSSLGFNKFLGQQTHGDSSSGGGGGSGGGQEDEEQDADRAIQMTGLEGSDLRIILPNSARSSQSSFQSLTPISPTWTTFSSTSSIFSPRILSNRPLAHPQDTSAITTTATAPTTTAPTTTTATTTTTAATAMSSSSSLPLASTISTSETAQHPQQYKDVADCRQQAEQDNPHAQYTLATLMDSNPDIKPTTTSKKRSANDPTGSSSRDHHPTAFYWYKRAARLGHVEAMHKIGAIYLVGGRDDCPDQNYREAARWLRRAAKQGYAPAQNDLGVMFQRGILAPKGEAAATAAATAATAAAAAASTAGGTGGRGAKSSSTVSSSSSLSSSSLLSKSASTSSTSSSLLGTTTQQQQQPRTAQKEAFKWFLQAAVKGCATAQCNLAWYPLNGRQVEQSDKEAMVWLRKAAHQGDDAAMNYLGWMHLYGRGVAQNDPLAFNWFLKAAMLGSADGQCNLGWMHMHGRGTPVNYHEAVSWFRKAILQASLAPAYYNLAWLYLRGEGVSVPSAVSALKLFRKAAKQGHADAQYCVGWMYARGSSTVRRSAGGGGDEEEIDGADGPESREGHGEVAQDYEKAQVWLHMAAEQGCLQAQHCLGWLYHEGQRDRGGMTRKSSALAVKWFLRAAEQGYMPSQVYLAKMYKSGSGVTKDLNQARAWLKKAADQGSSYAIQKLEALESSA
ncbi:hypothetical protein DFQ27_008821 [Actinomortierella ambigua]|uniref:Protein kinase domain-containing protein n=1 Tax=Actinomortierella ambigua TaxID=1343610 RepID=A0A9P6TXW4_9FUNG|nr:hypothetical protein DFQ27_008821 [Actinomortierella ambigua]